MIVGMDCETHLIRPGLVAPPMVCVQIASDVNEADVIHRKDPACFRRVEELVDLALLGEIQIVGQNISYDLCIWANEWPELLEPIFQMIAEERILDTQTRQKMIDIARGVSRGFTDGVTEVRTKYEYHLKDLAKRHGYPVDLDKDMWRLRYAEFDDVPVAEWPQGAVDYAMHDPKATLWVALAQEKEDPRFLVNQFERMKAAWGLYLTSAWGIRTQASLVARHKAATEARLAAHEANLFAADLIYIDKKGILHKRNKKAQERAALDNPHFPKTKGGGVSLSADAADHYTDPLVTAFIEYANAKGVMDRVAELERGTTHPIHTRFDELVDTGRTSSSRPNIQNRATKVGDRECFHPRDGHVFIIADVPGLELRTVAQVCLLALGKSRLAGVLNEGGDPHAMLGAQILGIELSEFMRRKKDPNDEEIYLARQTGKVGNFGLPAGLGWKSLIIQARSKYDVILDEEKSKRLIDAWHATWPEFKDYFAWVKSLCGQSGYATLVHFLSNRYRGHVRYTVAANSFFQGLGADATLAALWALQKECFVGNGALRGSRNVNFVHDEYIVETREEFAHEAAEQLDEVVTKAANRYLPDVPIPAMEPMLTRRWSKLARVWRESGRLVPWEWITTDGIVVGSEPGKALVHCAGSMLVGGEPLTILPGSISCESREPLATGTRVKLTYSSKSPWHPQDGDDLPDGKHFSLEAA